MTNTHTSHRAYTGLADYAAQQGAPESAFIAAGWQAARYQNRPALLFTTATGRRVRFIDGNEPRYTSPPGYQRCWYGLEQAVEIARATGQPLIIVNGEAGVVVAQHHGLAACCVTSGEKGSLPGNLLADLQAAYSGAIRVAFDCDDTGKKAGAGLAGQLTAAGFAAQALDLSLPNAGGDMADFCKAHGDRAGEVLAGLPVIESLPVVLYQRETQPRQPVAADDQRAAAYATAAIDRALAELAATTTDRNNTGFRLGCVVYGFVLGGWPGVDRGWIESRLEESLRATGLPMPEIRGLLASIRKRAEARPLELPDNPRPRRSRVGQEAKPWPPNLPPVKLDALQADQSFPGRYLPASALDCRTAAVHWPLAGGKTSAIITDINQHGYKRVLYLTYQQSLTHDALERFNAAITGQPFELYSAIPAEYDLSSIDRLICSIDSLHRIDQNPVFDAVYLDETEQDLQALFAGTLKGKDITRAYLKLVSVFQNAGKVVFLDAHLSQEAVAFLKALRPDVVTITNSESRDWGKLAVYQHESALIAGAQHLAETATAPVVITTASRTFARACYRLFSTLYGADAVKVMHGWNSHSQESRRMLKDLNAALVGLKVFITSPTIGTGADIQTRVAGVFGHFVGSHQAPPMMLQQMLRYRNADQHSIFIEHKVMTRLITDPETLLAQQRRKAARTARIADFAQYGTENVTPEQGDIMRKLWGPFTAKHNRQMVNRLAYFVALAGAEGFTITWDGTEAPTMKEALKAARQEMEKADDEKRLTLEPVSRLALDLKRLAGELVEDDHLAFQRWQIEDATGQAITPDLLTRYKKPAQRQALYRFTDFVQHREVVKQKDRDSVENLPFTRHHHTANRTLLEGALTAAFGAAGLDCVEWIPAAELTARVQPFIEAHAQEIQDLDGRSDLSTKPIRVFARLLARFGIKLTYKQVRLADGSRSLTYALDRDTLIVMRHDAHKRLEHLEKLSKNAGIAVIHSRDFRQIPSLSPPPVGNPYFNPLADWNLSPEQLQDALQSY